jgi:hypothetical protein
MSTSIFLTEGGVYGHMSHLHDNPDLTFAKMKEILAAASSGKLTGTEKTDGQNLFVSYNVASGEAKAARNKGNVMGGGLTAAALADKFGGRGAVEDAFNDAFEAFEMVANSMPKRMQKQLFGDGKKHMIFYNAEVQDPRNANVINYDYKTLNIHRVGHFSVDLTTGALAHENMQKAAGLLESALEATQDKMQRTEFRVQMNAIRTLAALDDDKALAVALSKIENTISQAGISDDQTIGDYMVAKLVPVIRGGVDLPQTNEKQLIKRILKIKNPDTGNNYSIKEIVHGLDKSVVPKVKELVASGANTLVNIIEPIEMAIHDFAVEMLKGLESVFVIDQGKEVDRLRAEIEDARTKIKNSSNQDAIDILDKQFRKIKDIENISTASEGFVFDYDGQTYKFTGNFAPVNQILGMFKYGRKGIPAIKDMMVEASNDHIDTLVVLYPGRFQPMGRHHASAFKWLENSFPGADVKVVTSGKVQIPRSPLTFIEKQQVATAHGIDSSKFVETKQPYRAQEVLSSYDPEKTAVVFMVGAKDMDENPRFANLDGTKADGTPAYFKTYNASKEDLQPLSKHGYIIAAPHVAIDIDGIGEMSGTSIRKALSRGDEKMFKDVMQFEDRYLLDLFKEKFSSGAGQEGLNESKKKFTMQSLSSLVEDIINEFTSAAAISGPMVQNPNRKKKGKKNMISRDQIIREQKLKLVIRNIINNKIEEQESKINNEESKLRQVIKQLLSEATPVADNDPAPHASTGINVLEDLLKKIIPIIEIDFKKLTSSEEQRSSYRSHMIKAVADALAPQRIAKYASPGAAAQLEEQEDEAPEKDLDVKISSEENKFIPITDEEPEEEPEEPDEKEQFGISGKDRTGRNVAYDTFKKIGANIIDAYDVLEDEKDMETFYDYLLTNLKLYFDKFTNDIVDVEEPTTDEYEAAKQSGDARAPAADGDEDYEEIKF